MQLKSYDVLLGNEIDLQIRDDKGVDTSDRWSPEYRFNILLHLTDTIIGYINIRIGEDESLEYYYGHIGYGIDINYRGNKYATKACELAKQVLVDNSVERVIITCTPNNIGSRKTCEGIGAMLIDIIDIPVDSEAYLEEASQKCRYEWRI